MQYQNRKVTESNRLIKNISRSELAGYLFRVALAVFLFFMLSEQVRQLFTQFVPIGRQVISAGRLGIYARYFPSGVQVSTLASSYGLLTGGALTSGLCGFMLEFFRKRNADPVLVLSGFATPMRYVKSIEIGILRSILVLFGLMLYIVPGIFFLLRTSQANYLLMDDPSKTGFQCLRESWALMRGNSMRLFNLWLSYLPYLILGSLPFVALVYLAPENDVVLFLLTCACFIPFSFVMAYVNTGLTAFFDLLTGRLVIDRTGPGHGQYGQPGQPNPPNQGQSWPGPGQW